MTKSCKLCKKNKKHEAHGLCRTCYSKTRRNKNIKTLREFIDEYKTSQGCIDCGYNEHPIALDFDHVSGQKTMGVSRMARCRNGDVSIEELMSEIEKCEVRCSNCHRIVTESRNQF